MVKLGRKQRVSIPRDGVIKLNTAQINMEKNKAWKQCDIFNRVACLVQQEIANGKSLYTIFK